MSTNDDPVVYDLSEVQDENGVDRTVTRGNLKLTPLECLQIVEELLQFSEMAKPWKSDSSD